MVDFSPRFMVQSFRIPKRQKLSGGMAAGKSQNGISPRLVRNTYGWEDFLANRPAFSRRHRILAGFRICEILLSWLFDEGPWSVRADGRVMLAPQRFTENGPEGLRLQPYAGRLLQFAPGVELRPKADYFSRHRAFHALSG